MKKQLLAITFLLVCSVAFCQTAENTFEYIAGTSQSLSPAQIKTYIAKGDYESYRLQSQPSTLKFDNGFEIILTSAKELQQKGLISNANTYRISFPAGYRMPVFHMTANGVVGAGYPTYDKKYSTTNTTTK